MEFLVWNEKLSLNIKEIDDQHKHLIKQLNNIHDAVINGSEQRVLEDTLNELIDYTVYHFDQEEELITKYGYPEIEEHKKEHNNLIEQVLKLQKDFRDGSATISFEVLDFLQSWVIDHIMETDMKYKDYIKQ